VLRVPENVSLALHAAGVLAMNAPEGPLRVNQIAAKLGASQTHLAKVMQQLVRAGLVTSRRGPNGGFVLARSPQEIRLIEVYEAVAGPLRPTECLLANKLCDGRSCLFGDLLGDVQTRIANHLVRTTLSGLAWPHLILEP
jgi:Rrf2 family protein